MKGGMEGILSAIRQLEQQAALPAELQRLEATSLAGMRGRSSQVIEDIAKQMHRQGHQFRAEMLGGSTVRFSMLGRGAKGAEAIGLGATFDVPLQIGGFVKGLPQWLRDPQTLGFQEAVRRSEFIGRGRFVRMGDKVVPATWIESVGYGIQRELSTPVVGDQGLRDVARNIQRLITGEGYQGLVWAGAQRLPVAQGQDITDVMAAGYYARAGSIYDIFQMGTVGIHRGPGIAAPKLIQEFAQLSKFPFQRGPGGTTFDPALALKHVASFLEEAKALGIQASDRAIKAESALAGNLGIWGLGEIVPFGETADPARQAYQRLAIAQLAGKHRYPAPVSTPTVEAMKGYVTGQLGKKAQWTVESRLALVLDPRFEHAVAGSGGGAIVTPGLAKELAADITQMADWEQPRWLGMMERGSGRIISKADIGTPVITSLGTKHTIASIQKMHGARMAIGWSAFLKGKNPEALREAVVRDVVEQVMTKPRDAAGRYTAASLEARWKFQQSLLGDLTSIFDKTKEGKLAGTKMVLEEGIPQLQIGPQAEFGTAQLDQVTLAINRYNSRLKESGQRAQELGLREIRKGFEISSLKIGGTKMRSMFVQASIMRRLEAAEVITKAVGAWTRPAEATAIRGFEGDVEYYAKQTGQLRKVVNQLYHPRGIKMGLRDLTNLELYKTKEADQLATEYHKYVSDWARKQKQELHATVAPFLGVPGKELSPVGFPDIEGAIEFKDFAKKYGGKFQPSGAGVQKTAADLAGTIFDPTSPMRRSGMAIKLPWEIEIGGVPTMAGEIVSGIPTRQIYLPSVEAYRGILKDPALLTPETAAYLGKLERAHERLFLGLAVENPDKRKVEALARQYYNTLGSAFGGKSGLLSYLSTARMAHSGYFGLVPGGIGPSAKALGTATGSPFIAQISETSAKQLGVYGMFKEKGELFGRVSAYPGIGPTMETVLQFRMAKDTELGAKRMRISNLMALTMFRDFDADKAGITFLTGERAQHLSKQFYDKTVVPRLKWYENIVRDDPELAAVMSEEAPYYKQLAKNIEGYRKAGKSELMDYGQMIWLAQAKDAKIQGKLSEAIARKYTTKALTGPVNWYLSQFRMLAQSPGIGKDIQRLGFHTVNPRLVGGVLGLIEQQAAISKGKEVAGGVQGLFRLMGKQFNLETAAGKKIYAEAIDEGAKYLFQMTGADPAVVKQVGEAQAIFSSLGRGEFRYLSSGARRRASMRQLLEVGQVRHEALAKMKAGLNVYTPLMQHMAKAPEVETGFHALTTVMMDAAERQSALSGEMTALAEASQRVAEASGFVQSTGLKFGADLAGVEARATRIKAEQAALEEINQTIKTEARGTGMTILDRASRWWTNTKTPYWQRAGVITGAAIILGAIAKNTLFPSYGTPDAAFQSGRMPAGPPPIIMAAPPIEHYQGPTAPPQMPYAMHKKPGGIWAYVQDQVGFGPESYGVDAGRGQMPMAKPAFGPRKYMPGMGLDVGPGIADSDMHPMILTGPPVGGGAPLPPAMPGVSRSEPDVPYTTPLGEPTARMSTPEILRPGMMVSALQVPGRMPEEELGPILGRRLGGEVQMTMDRWDPSDSVINRMVDLNAEELSSFT
jgi:hypothetical protein